MKQGIGFMQTRVDYKFIMFIFYDLNIVPIKGCLIKYLSQGISRYL